MPKQSDFIKANPEVTKKETFVPKSRTPYLMQKVAVADKQENHNSQQLKMVNPDLIKNWEFHDRPKSELGDIGALANDFLKVGQQQPCVVRPIQNSSKHKYELIIGERRWRAAKSAGIDLKVIVDSDMTDAQAALAQATENDSRIDLSDYAKGMSFSKLINERIIQQKDLMKSLGKSHQYISALLSFAKIPAEIIESVGDWGNVSSRTSETIVRLSKKGQDHIDAIITLSERIKSGKLGWNSLSKLVLNSLNEKQSPPNTNKKILSPDGRHMFTWRMDNNNMPSIHFPKQINDLFSAKKIDVENLTGEFMKLLQKKINEI